MHSSGSPNVRTSVSHVPETLLPVRGLVLHPFYSARRPALHQRHSTHRLVLSPFCSIRWPALHQCCFIRQHALHQCYLTRRLLQHHLSPSENSLCINVTPSVGLLCQLHHIYQHALYQSSCVPPLIGLAIFWTLGQTAPTCSSSSSASSRPPLTPPLLTSAVRSLPCLLHASNRPHLCLCPRAPVTTGFSVTLKPRWYRTGENAVCVVSHGESHENTVSMQLAAEKWNCVSWMFPCGRRGGDLLTEMSSFPNSKIGVRSGRKNLEHLNFELENQIFKRIGPPFGPNTSTSQQRK